MMKPNLLLIPALVSILFSCQEGTQDSHNTDGLDSTALSAITEDAYKAHVVKLSSDEFLGRKPFTKGDTLTVQYIEQQFKDLGLQPGNGESFFQEVPLVEIASEPKNKVLTFKGELGTVSANHLDDYVIGSRRLQDDIDISESELVFVGFGIVAPEFDWNDYEGLDVKGKTVVALVSDPGRYDKSLFKADTMTYYGRWKYKYEEAARQGATGILLIHETEAASYGWNVVRSGWSGPQLELVSEDDGASFAEFEGWISNETSKKLFQLAGISPNIIEDAKKPGFKAVPLNVTTSVSIHNTFRKSTSNNVIAKLEGSKRQDEVIIYTAHWDHLGVGEPVDGDAIYNGAIDNAAGVAALFEIAKAFQSAQVKPERSIIFLAVTAEEEGLLGSAYYAQHPIYPLNKTVANLNMDAFSALGATKDVSVVGIGQTEIEDYVEKSAAKFGRIMKGESDPTSGGFYRSDHFNFVKAGVPGLFMGAGSELLSTDTADIERRREALAGRYHTVADEVDENWDFGGIIEDIRLFFDIGYTMSMESTFPNFKAKSEFKELGDKRLGL
ncbi:M28 family metallopeptidase [Sphingobacterium chuzhouense]|uniref:M28 family peptidase n=1 Tax=Sphingobacterium chuzhouense TaxID=1742264 RepID=A0ABR7XU29_9SPHI|nr:M28 family metallopeptidase [Sphingobacterium chuzhouense]MBD1422162.1 M28 family peptidase [Sphingobacterium chuzhouense]